MYDLHIITRTRGTQIWPPSGPGRHVKTIYRSSATGSIPSWSPWSCIFRYWSLLSGLKMYMFLTLKFTLVELI